MCNKHILPCSTFLHQTIFLWGKWTKLAVCREAKKVILKCHNAFINLTAPWTLNDWFERVRVISYSRGTVFLGVLKGPLGQCLILVWLHLDHFSCSCSWRYYVGHWPELYSRQTTCASSSLPARLVILSQNRIRLVSASCTWQCSLGIYHIISICSYIFPGIGSYVFFALPSLPPTCHCGTTTRSWVEGPA